MKIDGVIPTFHNCRFDAGAWGQRRCVGVTTTTANGLANPPRRREARPVPARHATGRKLSHRLWKPPAPSSRSPSSTTLMSPRVPPTPSGLACDLARPSRHQLPLATGRQQRRDQGATQFEKGAETTGAIAKIIRCGSLAIGSKTLTECFFTQHT